MVNLVDDDQMEDDEVELNMPMGPPLKSQWKSSVSESRSSTASNIKGLINLFYS